MSEHVGYGDEYQVFRIDDGERHWYVAMSNREALVNHAIDSCGYSSVEEYVADNMPVTCAEISWDEEISFVQDDQKESQVQTKKACEWALECRGLLCATVW